jgi:hypothetical protein
MNGQLDVSQDLVLFPLRVFQGYEIIAMRLFPTVSIVFL